MSKEERGDVAVLVPAAGAGRRLGGQRKQFRLLGGRPLLEQTLRTFAAHPSVDELVVAVPPEAVDAVAGELAAALADLPPVRLAVVAGGDTRQASVGCALAAASAGVALVLVHDAVRPFVTPQAVRAVVEAAWAHGAASLAVAASDTLRRGADGVFGETVDRAGLYRMQTPQAFHRALFAEAHAAAARDGYTATDDVDLVQRLGRAVHIVEGDARNIKVTTPADWALAQLLWAAR